MIHTLFHGKDLNELFQFASGLQGRVMLGATRAEALKLLYDLRDSDWIVGHREWKISNKALEIQLMPEAESNDKFQQIISGCAFRSIGYTNGFMQKLPFEDRRDLLYYLMSKLRG